MAPRFAVPDATLAESLTAARCRVLLDPLPSLEDDPAGALVAASERARLREPGGLHADDIAAALTVWARDHRRHRRLVWTEAVMIERAAELLDAAGERDGADDARRLRARWRTERAPADAPSGLWRLPWLERSLVVTDGDRIEVLPGLPAGWFGQSVDVHEVPVDRDRLSFALRWHGTRAALLWECTASRPLGCARLDASWSTSRARGEALLAPPAK